MTTIVQKTIVMIAIFLLTLSFNNVAKASCDEPITYSTMLNDDCCVEITITSPNPAGDKVSIELPKIENSKVDIKIYALDGKLVAHKLNINGQITLDTKRWVNGTYIVRVLINEQEINITYKFMVVH